jgi:hypothetical protein
MSYADYAMVLLVALLARSGGRQSLVVMHNR